MKSKLVLEHRLNQLEHKLCRHFSKESTSAKNQKCNENIMVSTFDCARLSVQIENLLASVDGAVDVNDDNALHGFINVGIITDDLIVSYDIIVEKVDHMQLIFNDENDIENRVGYFKSLDDCGKQIAKHFKVYLANFDSI